MADDVLFTPIEQTVTKRVRCAELRMPNPHGEGQVPSVNFVYEEERNFGGGQLEYIGLQPIGIPFDPARLIYLRNPQTNEFLGATTTWGEVFVALFSAALDEYERLKEAPSMADKPATIEVTP